LPLSPKDRDQYQIGDWQQGIDFNHRAEIFARLNLAILHQTKGRCLSCRYKKFCALPLPLWLWTQAHKKSFDLFFDNFCALARIFIKESFLIEKRFRNKIDRQRILIFNKKDILT